jgi:hypothetical protein
MSFRISHSAFRACLVALLSLGLAGVASADQIRQRSADGSVKSRSGKIKEMTKEKVVLELTPTTKTDDIPANMIESVSYDGQPPDMTLLPAAVRGGNFANATELIRKLSDAGAENPGLKDELAFYKVYVDAKVAMGSGKLVDMKTALDALNKYIKGNLGTWHYYEAVELLGEMCLAVAAVEVETARSAWYRLAIDESYTRLAGAPWDETKIRGIIAKAKAQHLNKETQTALGSYDEAIKLCAGKEMDAQIGSLLLAANVGKAEVVGETKPDDGIKLLNDIIAKADAEDTRVQAMSALAIARCYEKAGKSKEALLNYLKVDVLYFAQGNLHAEALYQLSQLWNSFNHPERAKQAAETLRTRYPGSIWAAKLGAG